MDRRGLAKRFFGTDYLAELTSRMRSQDIPQILDRLESGFDPELEEKRKEAFKTKDKQLLFVMKAMHEPEGKEKKD